MPALMLVAEHWSCGARAGLLVAALAVAALSQLGFKAARKVMVDTGGVGIFGFEMIGTWEKADPLVERWRKSGRGWRAARWSLAVDVPFLVAYGFGLWLLAAIVADHARDLGRGGWAGVAAVAGYLVVVAALLDAAEDLALLLILYGNRVTNWPAVSTLTATLKFLLLGLSAAAVITVSVAFLGPDTSREVPFRL